MTVTTLLSPKLESLDMADSGHAFSLSASLLTERNGRFISDGGSLGLARRMGDGEGPSVHPSGGNGKTSSSEKEPLVCRSGSDSTQKLSVVRKLAYAVGSMPYAMCSTVLGFYFIIFLLEVAILDPVYVMVIVFLGQVWNGITDPIVGYLCLITRTPFGRLRPWMMAAVVPAGLVYTFLWFVPPTLDNDPPVAKFIYYISMFFVFEALLTCIHVPYTSLTMHLSHDNKERDSATLYRIVFEILGTIVGIGIYTIYFVAFVHSNEESCDEGHREPSIPERMTYLYHAVTMGILMVVMILVTFLGVREQQDDVETKRKVGFLHGVRLTFGFRPFLYLFLLNLFSWLTIQFIQGNIALYIKYSLGLGDQYPYIIAVLLVSIILWMPFWQFVMIKLGKKTAFAIALWLLAPVLLSLLYITYVPYLAYPAVVYSALCVAALYLIPWSMVPDVIDEACVTSLVRREELFYSYFVFGNKFAGGIALAISTGIYKAAGYDENKCQQPWQVALTLKLLVVVPSVFFLLIALLFLHLYPVNEAQRAATKRLLDERRNGSTHPPPSSSSSSPGGSVTVAIWTNSHSNSHSSAEITHL